MKTIPGRTAGEVVSSLFPEPEPEPERQASTEVSKTIRCKVPANPNTEGVRNTQGPIGICKQGSSSLNRVSSK